MADIKSTPYVACTNSNNQSIKKSNESVSETVFPPQAVANDADFKRLWDFIQSDERFKPNIKEWGKYFDIYQATQKGSRYYDTLAAVDNARFVFAKLAKGVMPKNDIPEEFQPSEANGERFLPAWYAQKYESDLAWINKPRSWQELHI